MYSVMGVNIYIFFCGFCVLAFSDVAGVLGRGGGAILKLGFVEGKKIKAICFYVSAVGRCKVTGKPEGAEE